MRNLSPLALIFGLGFLAASCSSGSSSNPGGTGGAASATGGSGTGGTATGGTTGSGGTHATGGATGSGGTVATGGNNGSGGTATGGQSGTGGTTGAGGATGHGGSSGTGGSGTGGTTATGGAGGGSSGSAFFTDDFESDTAGQQPAGWDNIIAYNYKTTNPMGSLSALADSTHTHNGSKLAVHFKSDGGMAFLERPLPTGTNHLFVRAYFYMTRQLGMGPSNANHESLLGITMEPNDANNEVRFGEIKGAVGTNLVPDDDIAPVMAKWNGPPIISANEWHCIEVEFDGSATYNTLNAWADGTLVHSVTQGQDWAHAPGEPANWMSGMFNTFFLGWQSFDGSANDVWADDLALGSTRIGCN
jgi:hypothetical protein